MSPTTAPRPRIAIYARQSEDVDQGIVQQLDDCRKEAVRRNWRVVAEFRDNDTGASKARGPKTDWSKMLQEFDAGTFDVLLVTETSRLTRSLTDVLDVCPPRRDMRVVVIREGIDTDIDDFMLKQLVLLAEREVKIKAARAARYAAERRKEGHPSAGLTPHGYRWVPASDRGLINSRYAIDEPEASDVRRIFTEFLAGAPLGQIARDLNDAGRSTRRGARWRSDLVRRILMNPFYAAQLPPAQPTGKHSLANIDLEACTPGAWEAIVGLEQLIAARGRLVGVKPNHNGTARRWLLSGLAVCSVCSEPVRSARGRTHPTARKDGSGTAPSQLYHTYRCVNGHFMRNGDVIDDYVAAMCVARLSEPDAVTLLVAQPDGEDISTLHNRRDALRASRKNVFRLIDDDPARLADAEDRLNDLEGQLRTLDEEITRVTSRNPFADLVGVEDVRAWWESATLARRRSVVDFLVSVSIRPVGKGRRIADWGAVADSVRLTPKI
ncbi:recombinase family protein [Arthrobacter sp. BL-252-APC-1A]|uniref:recombinase family protein n=1 Tax=Arthrobacter sp. BL-252-APC-1A TaxID=2606622 RepID=UPI0012B30E78|nr:recombinase family protein [Arthrobacter sp. BL-252-APC-1A]MSR99587.1 recombinase family protein [Arthrobacter sp. BL-252-APC-1A]